MSLLGNRGRFSLNENLFNNKTDGYSVISSIGKNPYALFSLSTYKPNDENDIRNKFINSGNSKLAQNYNSLHQDYNKKLESKINKYDKYFNDSENINSLKKDLPTKKKHIGIIGILAMIIVEIIAIIAIYFAGSFVRLSKKTQVVPFDKEVVIPPYISETTLSIMSGYKTVAIFGVDSRNGSISQGSNADVNIIANLNLENGEVQLISIYRDLFLNVTDGNLYEKLNSAYRKGGPEAAVKAINKNFDLGIINFFSFNWKAVADGINLLGGIDIEVTKAEFKYLNAFIHETCIATGIDDKNPAAHYISSPGLQHLDGIQAVAYGRLRLMDSDFSRVDRQKKVIALCLQKAKKLDIQTLKAIIDVVLPQIAYEFDFNEMISLLKIVRNVRITESSGCPEASNVLPVEMGASGDCIVPINLEKATIKLHKILFNEDDYKVSSAVRNYSNRITELRRKYQEENALKESMSQLDDENDTTGKKSISTRSNATKSKNKNKSIATKSTTNKTNTSNLPISTNENYEEEPENDESTVRNNSDKGIVIDGPPTGNENMMSSTNTNNDTVIGIAPGEYQPIQNSNTNINPTINNNQNNTMNISPNGPISEVPITEPIIVIP